MKPIEVHLNSAWIKEIMEMIVESLEVDGELGSEEKDAMEMIIVNAIALYQSKITEHLQVDKNSPLN